MYSDISKRAQYSVIDKERGVVLISVVFVVALLGVLVLQFNYLTRLDARMASHYRDNLQAYYLAKAGVNQAIVLLEHDLLSDKAGEEDEEGEEGEEGGETKKREKTSKNEEGKDKEEGEGGSDHLEEDWAQPQEAVKLGAGEFVFKIVDEDRKFNVNLLAEEAVDKVLAAREEAEALGEEEIEEETAEVGEEGETAGTEQEGEGKVQSEEETGDEDEEETKIDEDMKEVFERLLDKLEVTGPSEMVKNFIDWIDNDDDGTAENDYYSALEPGYVCKNAPFDSTGEFALLRDMDAKLYRGENPREKIETIREEADYLYLVEDEEFPGLRHYLTAYSDGKINVNTASREVLEAVLGEDHEDLADEIIKVREELIVEDEHAFKEVNEVPREIEEDIPSKILERFKVSSSFFTILSEGKVGNTTARIRVVVQRLEDRMRILYWRFEGS